jgi:hypothetical protein
MPIIKPMYVYVLYPSTALKKWYTKISSVSLGLLFLEYMRKKTKISSMHQLLELLPFRHGRFFRYRTVL